MSAMVMGFACLPLRFSVGVIFTVSGPKIPYTLVLFRIIVAIPFIVSRNFWFASSISAIVFRFCIYGQMLWSCSTYSMSSLSGGGMDFCCGGVGVPGLGFGSSGTEGSDAGLRGSEAGEISCAGSSGSISFSSESVSLNIPYRTSLERTVASDISSSLFSCRGAWSCALSGGRSSGPWLFAGGSGDRKSVSWLSAGGLWLPAPASAMAVLGVAMSWLLRPMEQNILVRGGLVLVRALGVAFCEWGACML